MAHQFWPVLDLRLRVADLDLRPLTEADLGPVAQMLPSDVEQNPDSPRYRGAAEATARGTIVFQDYWRAMGTWTVDDWRLNFAVLRAGELIGAQELEAHDFRALRTVDSASFLATEVRGQGVGKLMRRAVLALAFGPLEAQYAITSAWHDNTASLGVSRSLGYVENGRVSHRRDGLSSADEPAVDEMVNLRLARDAWFASGLGEGVEIAGADAALPYFGLG